VSSRRSPQRRLWIVVVLVALLSAACAHNAPQDSLKPAGPESRYIDHLFFPVFWIAVGMFVLVLTLVLVFAVKFRARSDDDRPRQIHGSPRLEIAWTIVPALLLVGVGTFSVVGIFPLSRTPKGQPITVQAASASSPATLQGQVLHVNVIAHRWWFEFDYPGLGPVDPSTGAPGTLVTAGELFMPVHTDAYLDVTSNEPLNPPTREGPGPGVIHTFWVPRLAGKIYAVPGRHSHVIINADNPGTYFGQCTQFCGISHANMHFRVVSQTPSDFAAWVTAQQQPGKVYSTAEQYNPVTQLAYQGYTLFNGAGGCSGCHTVSGTNAAGKVGPNLTHLQLRTVFAGDTFALNDANLRMWLRNPQAAKPGVNMVIPKLSEDQISALIAYLDTLK
jgi:cytochrome c oxidase subunit II